MKSFVRRGENDSRPVVFVTAVKERIGRLWPDVVWQGRVRRSWSGQFGRFEAGLGGSWRSRFGSVWPVEACRGKAVAEGQGMVLLGSAGLGGHGKVWRYAVGLGVLR